MAVTFSNGISDSEPEIEWDNSGLPQLDYQPSSANTSQGIPGLVTDSSASESEYQEAKTVQTYSQQAGTSSGSGPEYQDTSPCPTPNLEEKYYTAGEDETDDELYLPPLRYGSFRGTMASSKFSCDEELAQALAKIRATYSSEESS